MEVRIIRYPNDQDWARAYMLALGTEGKNADKVPGSAWRTKLLRSGHSPARTLMYTVELKDVPYWVAMHLVRHKVGIEHYVSSQRNDRQDKYDRNAARQDMPVLYRFDADATAIINISQKRLCRKASPETRVAWEMVCEAIEQVTPEMFGILAPACDHQGGYCYEFKSCGRCSRR